MAMEKDNKSNACHDLAANNHLFRLLPSLSTRYDLHQLDKTNTIIPPRTYGDSTSFWIDNSTMPNAKHFSFGLSSFFSVSGNAPSIANKEDTRNSGSLKWMEIAD